MSRPLKVPREKAVQAAMSVFWAKGYQATSVDDLQKAMGIQRGSFYFHFKDKRSLFIEVLDYYKESVVEKRRRLVRSHESPKAGIEYYFQVLLEHLIENKLNPGCLNTNTATEMGLVDKGLSKKINLSMQGWKDFWIEILEKSISKEEIDPNINIENTAQFLVGLTQGLNVISRVNPDPFFLKGIVQAGLSILNK